MSLVTRLHLPLAQIPLETEALCSELTIVLHNMGAQANFYSFQPANVRDLVLLTAQSIFGDVSHTSRALVELTNLLTLRLRLAAQSSESFINFIQSRLLMDFTHHLDGLQQHHLTTVLGSYHVKSHAFYTILLHRHTEEVVYVQS